MNLVALSTTDPTGVLPDILMVMVCLAAVLAVVFVVAACRVGHEVCDDE